MNGTEIDAQMFRQQPAVAAAPASSIVDLVPEEIRHLVHPHWLKYPPIEPMWYFLLGTSYIFLGIISICGNSLVLYLFTTVKGLRTPANIFVVNLAFSDLCMMLSQFPMFVVNAFGGGIWLFSAFACELYAATGGIFGLCSICTMAAISYDRYNVIVRGLKGKRMTSLRATVLVLMCWIYAIGWSLPPFFGWGRYVPEGTLASCSFDFLTREPSNISFALCLFFFDYCVPLTIIIICYFHIVRTIVEHEKSLKEQARKMNVTSLRSNEDQNKQSAEIRIAKVALINISLWITTWTPYAAIVLHGLFFNQESITPLVTSLPALIAKTASIYNPIIYAISHPKYRMALQEALPWLCISEEGDKASDTQSTTQTVTSQSL